MQTSKLKLQTLLFSVLWVGGTMMGLSSCGPRHASYTPAPTHTAPNQELHKLNEARNTTQQKQNKKKIVPRTVVKIPSSDPKESSTAQDPSPSGKPESKVSNQEDPSLNPQAEGPVFTKPNSASKNQAPSQKQKLEVRLSNPDLKDLLAQIEKLPSKPSNHLRSAKPAKYQQAVKQKRMVQGMNRKEVISSWGFFHDLQQISKGGSLYELFIYESGKRVYLKDGLVFSWAK